MTLLGRRSAARENDVIPACAGMTLLGRRSAARENDVDPGLRRDDAAYGRCAARGSIT
jgi:hypothetical protein